MIPQYNTKLLCEVWELETEFKSDFVASPFGNAISAENQSIIYALLLAKYANNPIANLDINQFKNKVFSIIWQYGPSWEKKLDIQAKIRNLTEEEITTGAKSIFNTALNDGGQPGTGTLEEILTVNSQNTTNYKKDKLSAYGSLWGLIETDVTTEFLNKFKVCFKSFVAPENPLLYEYEGDI